MCTVYYFIHHERSVMSYGQLQYLGKKTTCVYKCDTNKLPCVNTPLSSEEIQDNTLR